MSESENLQQIDSAAVSDFVQNLIHLDRDLSDAARIDLIRALEDAKSACSAAQAKVTADLEASRRAERAAAGVPAEQRGRGIAAEVALARRVTPNQGGRHLGLAQALVHEMPKTLSLLEHGILSEWGATILVRETACLAREDRTAIDLELCSDPDTLEGLGDRSLAARARACAANRDAEAMVRRARKAVCDRRVSIRPAPDTMAYVTALLPVDQAVGVYAQLGRDAAGVLAAGDDRTRSQIMADLLVQRVAGIDPAEGPAITVNLVLSDKILTGDSGGDAHVLGYGPIPAKVAAQWIRRGCDQESRVALRRVYADPDSGALTVMESKSRIFPAGLALLFDVRDRFCRTPWCDAPIRHSDHIRAHAEGGETAAVNGAGLCEACNYAKEGKGWRAEPEPCAPGKLHSYIVKTPSGHTYRSTAPPLPKPLDLDIEVYRPVEEQLIALLAAA